jgi:hypothetical protein
MNETFPNYHKLEVLHHEKSQEQPLQEAGSTAWLDTLQPYINPALVVGAVFALGSVVLLSYKRLH